MSPAATLRYLKKIPHEKFVLHGSPHYFETLVKPHQAHCDTGNSLNNQCAIYASMMVEIPAVCATIRGEEGIKSFTLGWTFQEEREKFYVHGENLVLVPGWIYVLPREGFVVHQQGLLCLGYKPVRAQEIVPVEPEMLDFLPLIELAPNIRR